MSCQIDCSTLLSTPPLLLSHCVAVHTDVSPCVPHLHSRLSLIMCCSCAGDTPENVAAIIDALCSKCTRLELWSNSVTTMPGASCYLWLFPATVSWIVCRSLYNECKCWHAAQFIRCLLLLLLGDYMIMCTGLVVHSRQHCLTDWAQDSGLK